MVTGGKQSQNFVLTTCSMNLSKMYFYRIYNIILDHDLSV